MMVQLILPILYISSLRSLNACFLLNALLHLVQNRAEPPNYVLLLLLFEIFDLILYSFDVIVQLFVKASEKLKVFLFSVDLVACTNTVFSGEVVDVASVLLLTFEVSVLPSDEVVLELFVLFFDYDEFVLEFGVKVGPFEGHEVVLSFFKNFAVC